MNWSQLSLALKEIDDHRNGEGFEINIRLSTGEILKEQIIYKIYEEDEMIQAGIDDNPPIWIPMSQIVAIELCS